MTTLIDAIRGVPEAAVRIWCGQQSGDLKIQEVDDGVRIVYEGRSTTFPTDVFRQAQEIAKILSIRPRLLRTVQDVLEIRHDAEDFFTEVIFGKSGIPKVLFVPAGTSASAYYRAMLPSELMREDGKVVSHFTMNVDIYKTLRYDILWIQFLTAPILIEIAKRAKAEGVRIVYDIDDRLDWIPPESQAASVYGNDEKQAEIKEMVQLADLVTVSTEPLVKYVMDMGAREARVLRNMVTANVIPRHHPSNPKFVRILWAGSLSHKRDLAIVAPALRNVLRRHAGKVRFTCFGERLPELLSDCYDWIDLQDPVDFESYQDKLASIAADFGIAPLEDNLFNASKSAVKSLEYASAGYPMLLSPIGEYPHVVASGLPARLVFDQEWEKAIEDMIALKREDREAIGMACLKWVCEHRCIGRSKASQWTRVIMELAGKKVSAEALK